MNIINLTNPGQPPVNGELIEEQHDSGAKVRKEYCEHVEPPAPEKEPQPTKMSSLAFMDLVGDVNMVTLLTLAKTDPVAELLVKKIDRADVIDFGDEIRGPKKGLMYLVSVGKISQEDFDRIMRREFLQ